MQKFKSQLSHSAVEVQSGRMIGMPAVENVSVLRLLAAGIASWRGGKPAGAELRLQGHGVTVSAMVLDDRG